MAKLLQEDISGVIGKQQFRAEITWRNGVLVMDEPDSVGGQDLGPDPYSTLLASLAGCTLSTLRMYIDRKGWDIPEIGVRLNMTQETEPEWITRIDRSIFFGDKPDLEMEQKLLLVAQKCPVSRILEHTIEINTTRTER